MMMMMISDTLLAGVGVDVAGFWWGTIVLDGGLI